MTIQLITRFCARCGEQIKGDWSFCWYPKKDSFEQKPTCFECSIAKDLEEMEEFLAFIDKYPQAKINYDGEGTVWASLPEPLTLDAFLHKS